MTQTDPQDIDDWTPDERWPGRSDPSDVSLVTLAEFARRADVPMPTVRRWISRGLSGVKLRTTWKGGRRMTSLQWYLDFNAQIATAREVGRSTDQSPK